MPTSSRETVLCRYRYDALDRQHSCSPPQQPDIQRFYCKSRLSTEIQGAVQTSFFQHEDQLLAQQQVGDARLDTTLLATDQQRSVLNALDANQPNPLAYSPYGHRPRGNGLLSLLGFNGERPDLVTGHYHLGNGYRQFNPVLMRFNSPDSLSPFGDGGLNAYAYCAGDPINRRDPTGHIRIPAPIFDDVFGNTQLLMRRSGYPKIQFDATINKTTELFGGSKKFKILADAKGVTPERLMLDTLLPEKPTIAFREIDPPEDKLLYLQQQESRLRVLLKNKNVSEELLFSENPYIKYLDETGVRNLKQDLLTNTNDLSNEISYLTGLRDGADTPYFNVKFWQESAAKLRTA
ncbi:RHS repeat-associated core domain-containing protein [Pseudomonas sp. 681]|uniref:RHS repeat-associated core domain-containing protein n=1 Tax=Pseudomonas fungipugnans TaxID=3024217 RepID=A0ABT6QQ96_9PSED|nr:RHS repeat-associated core domain-containing protein [Pseudomonas sp. 681]MDI2592397.1 RHS repeat-associated core domain-containing protein [Pseudomonas sp. 681]